MEVWGRKSEGGGLSFQTSTLRDFHEPRFDFQQVLDVSSVMLPLLPHSTPPSVCVLLSLCLCISLLPFL